MNADKLNKIYYGVAYYDEYMPYDRLKTDMEMIKKSGMNLIRIAESTWSTWEPKEGVFDFTHLHRVLKASQEVGLDVIVGTPTYAIPSWLANKYPDILCLTHHGQELYGRRQNMDITHPGFLEHAERIIRKLMEEVSKYPHVIGFQVDNETKHYDTCGPRVQKMFVEYLQKLYPDINDFNLEFGLNYWSNRVQDWKDFPDVRGTINGSIASEFEHFQRTLVTNYFHWQVKIINEYRKPEQFITHNFDLSWRGLSYGYQPDVNQFDADKALDISGVDIYHLTEDDLTGIEIALGGDITRSFKHNNYLVLETEAQGLHGWLAYPGQLRLQAFSHLASGAMCVEYWHWHSIHNSAESYWKGVLSHNLKENATYRDCTQIGHDFARLSDDLIHLKKKNSIAMMLSNRSITSFKFFPAGDINDQNTVLRWVYDCFYKLNFEMDMIYDNETDLSKYELIILPSLYSLPRETINRLREYVENGGHLLATFRTAFTDEHVKIYSDDQPFGLTEVFGMTYDQFTKPGKTTLASDEMLFEKKPVLSDWMELLIPKKDTKVIARYEHPYWKEYAAVTHHAYNKGSAAYIGCYCDSESLEVVIKKLIECFGIKLPVEHFPLIRKAGVNQKGEEIVFYFNYSSEKIQYKAPFEGKEIDENKEVHAGQQMDLNAWSFHILKKAK